MRRVVLIAVVVTAFAALLAVSYANAKHQPCTHGESSAAVSIYAGHVHVIRDVHQTGCTR